MRFSEIARSILSEQFTPPVTFARVVTPEWVKELLDLGFDTGIPHPDARTVFLDPSSRYDDMGVKAMIEMLQDDGLVSDEIEPYNYDDEDIPALIGPVTEFLKKRFAYVLREMHDRVQKLGNGIRVARTIVVNEETALRIAAGDVSLGEFWSFDYGQPFWHKDGGRELVMVGSVSPTAVDWITTMRRNMNYNIGDDEAEIYLSKGTPVTLHELVFGGTKLKITGRHWFA